MYARCSACFEIRKKVNFYVNIMLSVLKSTNQNVIKWTGILYKFVLWLSRFTSKMHSVQAKNLHVHLSHGRILRELHILKEIKYIYCLAAESYKLAPNAATDILSTHKSIYNRSGRDRSIYQTTFLKLLLYTSRRYILDCRRIVSD